MQELHCMSFFLKMFQSVVVLCMALFNCVVEFLPYLQCTFGRELVFFCHKATCAMYT